MQKSKKISKNNSSNGQKKPYRQTFNNNNPHNKLSLNKFHQIQEPYQNVQKKSDAFVLHKKKRDLQRMMKHCESKGLAIDQTKKQQLQTIDTQLNSRRKKYQKQKRKQYFLEQKYSNIKHIQQRKAYKGLDDAKANSKLPDTQRKSLIQEWQKKIRYIKNFPKTLKYISLFPSTKPLQGKSLQFQQKIMNDIEQEHKKKVTKLNYYKSENQVSKKKVQSSIMPMTNKEVVNKDGRKIKKVVDDFFVQEQSQSEQEQKSEQEQNQDMEDEQQDSQQDMQVQDDEESIQDEDE